MPDNHNSDSDYGRVVVFAVGDSCGGGSREPGSDGDDALGSHLLNDLRTELGTLPDWVTAIEAGELQLEHMLELRDCSLALFLGTDRAAPVAVALREIPVPDGAPGMDAQQSDAAEGLTPVDLLRTMNSLARHGAAPSAFALTLRGGAPGSRASPSATGRESLRAALPLLRDLVQAPGAGSWRRRCDACESPARAVRGSRAAPDPPG